MTIILALSIVLLLISLGLTVLRMVLGPTMIDRMLAVNLFGTLIVALIAVMSYLLSDYYYIDIALCYGLLNFIATIALLRYLKSGQFHE
jgi:multicomponent Na+:H+ antiporter subunit F